MKNKEIEELLKFLKEPFGKEKTHKAIDKKDTKLLLSYIEQLKKEYKLLKDRNEINIDRNIEAYRIVEQLENNRDKAIEYIEKDLQISILPNNQIINGTEVVKRINKIEGILKGDSDE